MVAILLGLFGSFCFAVSMILINPYSGDVIRIFRIPSKLVAWIFSK